MDETTSSDNLLTNDELEDICDNCQSCLKNKKDISQCVICSSSACVNCTQKDLNNLYLEEWLYDMSVTCDSCNRIGCKYCIVTCKNCWNYNRHYQMLCIYCSDLVTLECGCWEVCKKCASDASDDELRTYEGIKECGQCTANRNYAARHKIH